jgi:hypothetical protein
VELDDVKALWKDADARLESIETSRRIQQRLAESGTRERTRSRLGPVHLVLWYEIGFGVMAMLLIGSYLWENIGNPGFWMPAVALHAIAAGTVGSAAYQLVTLRQSDYTGPVVTFQHALAKLRVARARSNRWLLLSSPLIWALLVIVVPHGLLGVDVYRLFGMAWVLANLGFGVAVLGAAALVSRRLQRGNGMELLRRLGDDITGRRMAEAASLLDEIAAFEGR